MTDPHERHRERRQRYGDAAAADHARSLALGTGRGAAFVVALALGVLAEHAGGGSGTALTVGALVALAAFFFLVGRHRAVRERERWHAELASLAAEGLARLDRDWASLPAEREPAAPADHAYAADLDLLGPASLGRLLGTPATAPGRETIREWLLAPAGPAVVRERQAAVADLVPAHDFREELAARGRLSGPPDSPGLDRLLSWCESESYLASRPLLVAVSWALPLVTVGLAGLELAGAVANPWWGFGPALMLLVSGTLGSGVGSRLEAASAGETELGRLADVLEALAGVAGESAALEEIRGALAGGASALRGLGRRVAWAEARHSGMLHFALQILLLWDEHVLASLERWKARHGSRVRGWLEGLGRGEALAALATLMADNPGWCFPELRSGSPAGFEARDLVHPLLPPDRCVPNDVRVGPPGTFLLVTGSNMSGKSTLLRAIGLGAVLGRAGGPVPASQCAMTDLRVQTAMRVQDSLAEGISQYMAELRRVRRVVDAARRPGAPPVLYLLDEPLQGTNEAERRVALRIVVRHLLAARAVGAVATHDLRLDEVEDLGAAARPVHFEGEVREGPEGARLHFDYRLRPGPATSTNALELLRAVGLGEEVVEADVSGGRDAENAGTDRRGGREGKPPA